MQCMSTLCMYESIVKMLKIGAVWYDHNEAAIVWGDDLQTSKNENKNKKKHKNCQITFIARYGTQFYDFPLLSFCFSPCLTSHPVCRFCCSRVRVSKHVTLNYLIIITLMTMMMQEIACTWRSKLDRFMCTQSDFDWKEEPDWFSK